MSETAVRTAPDGTAVPTGTDATGAGGSRPVARESAFAFLARASAELAEFTDYRATLQRIAGFAIPAFADWCGIFLGAEEGGLQRLCVTHSDSGKVELLSRMRERYPYRPADPFGPGRVLATGQPDWSPEFTPKMLDEYAHDAGHRAMLEELGFRSFVCVPIRLRRRVGGVISFVMAESGRAYTETDLRLAEDLAHRVSLAIQNTELLADLRTSDQRKTELLIALREEQGRKDEFLAMLAQELRNPLAPIRNAVAILRAKAPHVPELHYARDVIERQVHQLTRLVDDLLDVSRVGKGLLELRFDRVSLPSVVNAAVEQCRALLDHSRHQLSVSIPMQPLHVEADPVRLAQVFANLLDNAIKYTGPGGRISIVVDCEGDGVAVRVKDTGVGIPPHMIRRVFEPFTQVDGSIAHNRGGLGLGLTLARRLVELQRGSIEATSDGVGRGSEFIVRLPLHRTAQRAAERGPGNPGARVLIVDDDRDMADTLAVVLRSQGHEVRTAYDGIEGLGAATSFKPDVVLLDIGLPKLYGYDVAREIRAQRGSDVLVVAITGRGQEEDRRRSSEAGFDHHLTKPVDPEALGRLVDRRRQRSM